MLLALLRAVAVWTLTLIGVWIPLRTINDGAIVPMLLGFFFSVPAVIWLVGLHFFEATILKSTLPIIALAIGPLLLGIGCLPATGPIAEVAWPMGLAWLATAVLRIAVTRPARSWP